MSKNIIIIILAALGALSIFLWNNDTDKIKKVHQKRIDSIQKVNDNLLRTIDDLKDEVIVKDMEQEALEKVADSLREEAKKPIPCEHKIEIQEQEIGALRGALYKCKEAKAIQAVTIKKYDSIVVNHEVVVYSHEQMQGIDKKAKKKSFLKGLGIGGGAGFLLTLLILL